MTLSGEAESSGQEARFGFMGDPKAGHMPSFAWAGGVRREAHGLPSLAKSNAPSPTQCRPGDDRPGAISL